MQRKEFESLTGIRPSWSMYNVIEKMYMNSEQNKAEFCYAYELNVDGIAEKIQRMADQTECELEQRLYSRIEELQKQLDKELERKFCGEFGTCMSQEDYLNLISPENEPHYLTDEQAVQLLSELFGFIPEQIKIRHWAEEFESNKYGDTRVKKIFQRDAVYHKSDYNYIRFDCARKRWELVNGELLSYDS